MPRWVRPLVLFVLFASAPASRAQGLVQLSLDGAVGQGGGAWIEVEVAAFAADGQEREAVVHAHVALGTTAADLAALVAQRMRAAGMSVVQPGRSETARHAQLFVDACTGVHLRLGSGLVADVTLCDSAPAAVRFLAPSALRATASVSVSVSTRHPHTEERGTASVGIEAAPDASAIAMAEALVLKSIEQGWVAQRPTLESWSPVKLANGHEIKGCSISLRTDADWGLQVELPRPEER